MSDDTPRVAIACQGGGSHTAFTAGVLARLFEEPDLDADVVGFSGTSGGAVCATLAWYGRQHPEEDPVDLLLDFWADLSARSPLARAANDALQFGIALHRMGVPTSQTTPYNSPAARWGQAELRRLLEEYVDFERLRELADGVEEGLFVSAIDVLSGTFEIFREGEVSADAVLASAAEPNLFDAVEVDGRYYWDGLFSKNPPLKDFVTATDVPDPDEVWLVRINPQERPRVPKTAEAIADRRNELAGNLSLNAEVRFLRQVNEWIEAGYLPEEYTHTEIRPIRLRRKLEWRTKLDRSPEFIERLVDDGREAAAEFLAERA